MKIILQRSYNQKSGGPESHCLALPAVSTHAIRICAMSCALRKASGYGWTARCQRSCVAPISSVEPDGWSHYVIVAKGVAVQ